MAKVLKVKRDQLGELGEEFTVLTDAEAGESGITLTEDEVLVVQAPAPVPPQSGDGNNGPDLGMLQSRLHTVNAESAQRRIQLKEREAQLKTLQDENAALKKAQAEREAEDTKRKAKELFTKVVSGKKLEFVSAEASEDVAEMVLAQLDLTKPFTEETVGPLVDGVVDKKKYVLKQVQIPPTDGGKQSSQGVDGTINIDMAQIARDFNLPYKEEGAK